MRVLTDKELLSLKEILASRKKKHGISHLRVAIYARKSAEDDKQTSIPTQISLCERFVSDYSDLLQVKYKFSEDDASGMQSYNRPEYLKMMSLAEQQLIDVIMVVKFDRLARDLADITTAIKLLNLYGCQLIAGDDVSDANTPAGEFMRSILFAQNQYHARRVASDVMATECHNAKNGLTAGGTPPFGLKIVDKRFEINHNEAPAVKLMFEMVDKGHSYADIINELERLGYTTRKNTPFTYTTINSMLRNDKYYGTMSITARAVSESVIESLSKSLMKFATQRQYRRLFPSNCLIRCRVFLTVARLFVPRATVTLNLLSQVYCSARIVEAR